MSKPAILCVDDEKMILVSLKEELKRNFGDFYTIETVESGEEALELIDEFKQDAVELPIVIADQLMPGMKGDELLINVHQQLPKTLKILLTGQAGAEAVGNAVNYAKLYRYISKPWQETDLTLTVNEALRSYFQDKKLEEQNAELQKLNLELERWNATLEQQVQERTAELEAQKIELAELNASKDKFFSIIAHDLRGPFNVLLGNTQLLLDHLDQYDLASIRKKIEDMRASSERQFALLENLLTWSRGQLGLLKYEPELLDLQELAEDVVLLFQPNAEQKQIELRHDIEERTMVYADYSMLNTVIRNLTSNALKFTSAGDRVEILAHHVDQRWLEVCVSDTGRGIPPDVLPKLLRIDSKYTTLGSSGEKGTGLGLILCRDLVEKNGGKIWIESDVDKGSNFRFTVPKTSDGLE